VKFDGLLAKDGNSRIMYITSKHLKRVENILKKLPYDRLTTGDSLVAVFDIFMAKESQNNIGKGFLCIETWQKLHDIGWHSGTTKRLCRMFFDKYTTNTFAVCILTGTQHRKY
jgi:hypothetical protein